MNKPICQKCSKTLDEWDETFLCPTCKASAATTTERNALMNETVIRSADRLGYYADEFIPKERLKADTPTDRAGFHRRWGVYIHREPRRSPFVSLGVHLDWHTPTLDLYLVRWVVQIGRNVWQEGRRFVYHDSGYASGHTDQCLCEREVEPSV